ncbi:MAG: hypothetical protein NT154_30545 [Verrucomicrobia bacterium]|nr:hypothetical protein [Verrucomicrobiota bacterium]
MNDELTSAKCRLCVRMLGKRQMTTHLKACWEHHKMGMTGKATARWYHLVVEARHAPDYWMHLQAPANCTFGDLDGVLRAVWLECCDHLSAFEFPVKRKRLRLATPLDMAAMFEELRRESRQLISDDDASDDALMGKTLGSRLKPGVVFSHQYDFGSTTELALRVAGEHTAPALAGNLKLLARNEPPAIPCSACAKPATQFCQQCAEEGAGDLCDACAGRHDCGEERVVPLINSPRTGVCGYCGPSKEP